MTGVDADDRLFRGIEQSRRALGRAEVALDEGLRALLARDRERAVERMTDAARLTGSASATLRHVTAPALADGEATP